MRIIYFLMALLLLAPMTPLVGAAHIQPTIYDDESYSYYTIPNQVFMELNETLHGDYICGEEDDYSPGDDCVYSTDSRLIYRETITPGSKWDVRTYEVWNRGIPNNVDLDIYFCWRLDDTNQMMCKEEYNNLYSDERHTFTSNSFRSEEYFVFIRAEADGDDGGDQTSVRVSVTREDGWSNTDQLEPYVFTQTEQRTGVVCQTECESWGSIDPNDVFQLDFYKGDEFIIDVWSQECESSSGTVHYQIQGIYIIENSLQNLNNFTSASYFYLDEQMCTKSDGNIRISHTAEESGSFILWLTARNGNDEDVSSYAVELFNFNILNRDIDADLDGDGFSDWVERNCNSDFRNVSSIPQNDYDGDGDCDSIDEDDDNDGILDISDECPQSTSPVNSDDYDADGCFNDEDTDDDNDGILDISDECPTSQPNIVSVPENDYDGDGCLNSTDSDDDNDGWNDNIENDCSTNPVNEQSMPIDTDGDGDCDPLDWDDDNDGVADTSDKFPLDPSESLDNDNDGIGDNGDVDDDNDGVQDMNDAYPFDSTQSADSDGDGCGDNPSGTLGDQFPYDSSQCRDSDGDGYGDDPDGTDPDAYPFDSSQWADSDGDGYGDNPFGTNPDAFPSDPTQHLDSDGDGFGDNPLGSYPDAYPFDATQWLDTDGDGFGDNLLGTTPDACPDQPGSSSIDVFGCSDGDSDGYSDAADACPVMSGTSNLDRFGCPDTDGDGISNADISHLSHPLGTADAFPLDSTQWLDSDSDGYGNNPAGNTPDSCPQSYGTSSSDRFGCQDSDGDSWSDSGEIFDFEPSQQFDTDEDGFGDNSDGKNGDGCPDQWGNSTTPVKGCLDSDGDGIANQFDHCNSDEFNTCWSAVLNDPSQLIPAKGTSVLVWTFIGFSFFFYFYNRYLIKKIDQEA